MLYGLYPAGWALPEAYKALVADAWPGPLTILLPRSPKVRGARIVMVMRWWVPARHALVQPHICQFALNRTMCTCVCPTAFVCTHASDPPLPLTTRPTRCLTP